MVLKQSSKYYQVIKPIRDFKMRLNFKTGIVTFVTILIASISGISQEPARPTASPAA